MQVFLDPVGTTSRAVLALCRHAHLPVALHELSLMKGEHQAPEFARLNPNRMVPVLAEGTFVLTESSAILRYLARRHAPELYPADPRAAAKVDELMAWFESNFYRDFGFQYVYPQLMPHHGRGSEQATRATIDFGRAASCRWLQVLDTHFLGHGGPFLCGQQASIADFHGGSILSVGDLVGCDLSDYPNVQRWRSALDLLPGWRESNDAFRRFARSLEGMNFIPLKDRHVETASA